MALQVKFDWKRHLRPKRTPSIYKSEGVSAASRSRQKVKEQDPEKHKEYLKKDAARKKQDYRSKLETESKEDKEYKQQKWREAKRKQRAKKEPNQRKIKPKKKIKDMSEEEKRQYYTEKRRENRAKQSRQKSVSIKQKETKARKLTRSEERRVKKAEECETPSTISTSIENPSSSKSTIHRRKTEAKNILPKSPRTFASVLEKIISQATPKKQEAMKARGIKRKLEDEYENDVVQSIQHTVKELQSSMTEDKRQSYNTIMYACQKTAHYRQARRIASSLGFGGKIRRKMKKAKKQKITLSRNKRKDATSAELKAKVHDHWYSEGISRVVPLKKRVKKGTPLYVLETSYTGAYRKFKASNPQSKIGYVTFLKLKPKNVRHLKAMERNVCCCQKCENNRLKITSLNKAARLHGQPELVINSIEHLSDITLCPYKSTAFPSKSCLDRACPNCGILKISQWYSPLLSQLEVHEVTYDEWTIEKEKKLIKVKGKEKPQEKVITALRLVTKKVNLPDLVEQLASGVGKFSSHIFRARWQSLQYRLSKQGMPGKCAVLVADFAENFACSMNNEVQTYHWSQSQVTIHPIMAHVNNSTDRQGPTHTEAIYCLTDDPKHDASAVHSFLTITYEYLKEKYDIEKVVLWSDCCASQYRGKASFADISFANQDTGLSLTRHYFEASHGKSEADGLAAIVKHAATVAVTRGHAKIRNAAEFHVFCEENLHSVGAGIFKSRESKYISASRKFFLVAPSDINRDRQKRAVKPVKGTMSIHSVKPTGVPFELKARGLSCFCDSCYHGQNWGESNECINIGMVGEWSFHKLKPVHDSSELDVVPSGIIHDEIPDESVCDGDIQRPASPTVDQLVDQDVSANCGDGNIIQQSIDEFNVSSVEYGKKLSLFEETLTKQFFRVQDVPGDGNCFFWALSYQLDKLGCKSSGKTHHQLRMMLITHLRNLSKDEQNELAPFLTSKLSDYIHEMSKEGCYADHFAVNACAKMLGAKIIVVESNDWHIIGHPDSCLELYVGYLREHKHYVSLRAYVPDIAAEDYVAVELQDQRSNKHVYIAKAVAVDADCATIDVKYLKEELTKNRDTFTWPNRITTSKLSLCYILFKLARPKIGPGRILRYTFSQDELKICLKKMKK